MAMAIWLSAGLATAQDQPIENRAIENPASKEEEQTTNEEEPWETITHVARSAQARRIAQTLKTVYPDDSQVRVEDVPHGDLVLLRVRPGIRAVVLDLLRQLDRPPEIVEISILFVELEGIAKSVPDLRELRGPMDQVQEGSTMRNAKVGFGSKNDSR